MQLFYNDDDRLFVQGSIRKNVGTYIYYATGVENTNVKIFSTYYIIIMFRQRPDEIMSLVFLLG